MGGTDIVSLGPDVWPPLAELFAAGGDPRWCWYKLQVGAQLHEGKR